MNSENLILVMARSSGSKEVSRQNLRLINGKPLLYYVLQTALRYKNSLVVVSTDSEEIIHLSSSYGAKIIKRPKNLTKDSTTLEDIASHTLKTLKKNNQGFKKCLIIHPHFPLISLNTIDRFFKNLSNEINTVFGFEEDSIHDDIMGEVMLKNDHNVINLLKKKRIVRTKKIVSFNCKSFLQHDSFTHPHYGIKIPTEETFSPTSYHDFASLENIINKKRILVRVDGSKEIGLGHVYNMLTVLNNLRKEEILIVMNSKKNLGFRKLREYLYNVKLFSSEEQLMKIIKNFHPHVIINDILDTSLSYMKKLKKLNCILVNFEDKGEGRTLADLVFNPIYQEKKVLRNEYYGARYSCVRDEFRIWQRQDVRNQVEQIIISFGGTDPKNKTKEVLKIINKMDLKHIRFKVVLGVGNSNRREIKDIIEKMKTRGFNIDIIEKSDFLAKNIIESDFAIISNGRTVFEVAAARVPIISIAVNQREKNHSFVRNANIGISLTLESIKDKKMLTESINKMMSTLDRKKYFENLKKIDLLKGVELVNDLILNKVNQTPHVN